VPAEQQAWFWLRIGDVQFRRGRFGEARNAYERGLAVHAEDYRLLAAMAKVDGAQRRWQSAIDVGARAVAASLDPATLGTMSDAYAALGDTARATEYAHAMEVAVSRQATAYHRAWSLFLLDHGRRTDYVLAKSQEDLATRRDIYGYDVAAWALHKKGRDAEAHTMMTHALALGTQDEMLFYHAAAIDAALGRARESAGELARARAIDPDLYVAGAR
jgi:tetratricopeptide (TPR) repeat protein